MPVIHMNLDGDGAWPDLLDRDLINCSTSEWHLASLEGGMESGAVSLSLRLDVPDSNESVLTQTSLAGWIAATCSLRGRYPEAFDGTPLALAPVVDGQRRVQ